MLIQCPECQFSRILDESKIPHTAQIATCPRCKARFNFRPLTDQAETTQSPQDSANPEQYQSPQADESSNDSLQSSAHDKNDESPQDSTDSEQYQHPQADEPSNDSWQSPEHNKQNEYDQWSSDPRNRFPKEDQEDQCDKSLRGNENEKPKDIWDQIASLGEKWDQNQSEHSQDYTQKGHEPRGRAGTVPWEHPNHFGYVGGFFKTIVRVLMRGKLFFSSMPPGVRMAKPLSFFLLIAALHFTISFLWIKLLLQHAEVAANFEQFKAVMTQVSLLQFVVPRILNASLTLVMLGFTFSLLFRLSGVKNVSIIRNIRILCYSSSGLVLVIIPIIGPVMSFLFVIFSSFQGFAYSYNLPILRVVLLALPVYFLLFLIVIGLSISGV